MFRERGDKPVDSQVTSPLNAEGSSNVLKKLKEPTQNIQSFQRHMEHLQNLTLCRATKQGVSQSVFFNPNVLKLKKNKGSNKRYLGKNLHVFGNSKQLSTIKK